MIDNNDLVNIREAILLLDKVLDYMENEDVNYSVNRTDRIIQLKALMSINKIIVLNADKWELME